MGKPRVLVIVSGGAAEICAEDGFEVLHLDYDVDGSPEETTDFGGERCRVCKYDMTTFDQPVFNSHFEHFKDQIN